MESTGLDLIENHTPSGARCVQACRLYGQRPDVPDKATSNSHAQARSMSRAVSLAALSALYDELCLYPKPGLVSKIDNGSHHDMTAVDFFRSLFSLRHYFAAIYMAGWKNASFEVLQNLGVAAEARMLHATGGINTHRGAIFNLGILSATIGAWDSLDRRCGLSELCVDLWSTAIKDADSRARAESNGGRACREYAVGGARAEAAAGFPHVFHAGLPALDAARAVNAAVDASHAHAFFAILGSLDDTNLLHRGGATGLVFAREAASQFVNHGGALTHGWELRAKAIHSDFIQRNLSPGGSADMLAATLFVDRVLQRSD